MSGLTESLLAASMITEERARQIALGYDTEHDDAHVDGEILTLAICYALDAVGIDPRSVLSRHGVTTEWNPSMKCSSRTEQLVVVAALVKAEIERVLRAGGAA